MGGGDRNTTVTIPKHKHSTIGHVPDLTEATLMSEKRTWEELMRIKTMPIPMAQKKILKAQLTSTPKIRLMGWYHFKYVCRKHWKNFRLKIKHRKKYITFFNNSIRRVELRCGTAIANVFLFIKWTLCLNAAVAFAMIVFVIAPYMTHDLMQGGKQLTSTDPHTCHSTAEIFGEKVYKDPALMETFLDCCRAKYQHRVFSNNETLKGKIKLYLDMASIGKIDTWPLQFSYYHDPSILQVISQPGYPFRTAYVFTGILILVSCLFLLVYNIAQGVREMIRLKEGEFYKYSSLVFSGWDHFTTSEFGANFKRRMIRNEIKSSLHTEKKKITDMGKTRREKLKLLLLRIFVNVIVLVLLMCAGLIIFYMTLTLIDRKKESEAEYASRKSNKETSPTNAFATVAKEFSVSWVISLFNLLFPFILTRLGKLEDYTRERETAHVLIRALFIRIFSVLALAAGYYSQIYCRPQHGTCVKCNWTDYIMGNATENTDPNSEPSDKLEERLYCWEGEFATQIYKLVVIELGMKTVLTFIVDPLRRLVKRFFKNRVAQRIGTLSFNIIRHSLDIIYIQILCWISFYFAPMMPVAIVVYCYLIFYIKMFGVMNNVNYVPDSFRTTRTTAVFMIAKILSFIVVLFTYAFVVSFMTPSRECGPFRGLPTAWDAVVAHFERITWLSMVVNIMFPGVAVPLTLVLILMSYYYYSVAQANRAMVETLRHLLILEGHDKQYLFSKLNTLRRTGNTKEDKDKSKQQSNPNIRKTIFRDPKLSRRFSTFSASAIANQHRKSLTMNYLEKAT